MRKGIFVALVGALIAAGAAADPMTVSVKPPYTDLRMFESRQVQLETTDTNHYDSDVTADTVFTELLLSVQNTSASGTCLLTSIAYYGEGNAVPLGSLIAASDHAATAVVRLPNVLLKADENYFKTYLTAAGSAVCVAQADYRGVRLEF